MESVDFYDESHNKAADRNFFPRENIALKEIEENITKKVNELNILDLGCGEGFILSYLSEQYNQKLNLNGLDYSEHQLEFARKKVPNASFSQADFSKGIPYEDESFDLIYSGEVIEHLYDPDFFVEEINRVLKKDGILVITTPNLCSWISRLFFALGIYPIFYESSTKNARYGFKFLKNIKQQSIPVGHIRLMNLDALESLLVDQKFSIQKKQGFAFHGFTGLIAAVDKFLANIPSLSSGFVITAKKNR
ncbi:MULTISPECIES: bifunctional 2-polyprenyl-6-hydroxyphenol methylase/3-demethylubiquinol 3-O-methyltransferase UbiG [Lysinibacillus]|uniref:Class I SAM-dependent methyltransferase n=1 Tax=Lysinibacillus antri TaxID=2498145 RepID=A0A3S0RJ10_9BACI|nr:MULTISPECIES: class I SAM-dependent methyltransferase [Lysinibacillus]RUL52010.1 class I SAM-dependent methyltransferase [Lysinibacillus antri]TSI05943.1 class I SAM-dependent methyltransferase [Lysinibacillus sp. BW-2-10]